MIASTPRFLLAVAVMAMQANLIFADAPKASAVIEEPGVTVESSEPAHAAEEACQCSKCRAKRTAVHSSPCGKPGCTKCYGTSKQRCTSDSCLGWRGHAGDEYVDIGLLRCRRGGRVHRFLNLGMGPLGCRSAHMHGRGGLGNWDPKFGPRGCGGKGCPPFGMYQMVYPLNPEFCDRRDSNVYAAQGYNTPVSIPLAPNVRHQFNYSWGVPASRITHISQPVPANRMQPPYANGPGAYGPYGGGYSNGGGSYGHGYGQGSGGYCPSCQQYPTTASPQPTPATEE